MEDKILSPWAARSRQAKRLFPEEECVLRTAYQRDRDRIIHSKSFRRLKHKTQVFLAPEGDHYRTRLTHTFEVMQIGRTISRSLRLNEDLTEAIALAHDLGHPPFGHAGEEALNEAVGKRIGGWFRHNEQSLRIVDLIEKRFSSEGDKISGLNLTLEVRDGILSHSKGLGPIEGFSKASTLEGEVVKVADQIAYLNHDLDDAIRAQVVVEKDIPMIVKKALGNTTTARIKTLVEDVVFNSKDKGEIIFSHSVREPMDTLKDFLKNCLYQPTSLAKKEEEKARGMILSLYDFLMEAERFVNFAEDERSQAVVDFIAGMTDRYALSYYSEHFLPSPWKG